ncbi:MAG: hypothetical protein WBI63_06185 [Coriobacteriia bacterium]
MEPRAANKSPKIAAAIALLAVVVLVAWLAVTQLVPGPKSAGPAKYTHPVMASSQTCTSCKATLHDYKHLEPYTDQACERCHSLDSWRDTHFTHQQSDLDVSFHAIVGCARCHTEGEADPSPACVSCHAAKSIHDAAVTNCQPCHTAIAWSLRRPLPEDHLSLEGGHASVTCFQCHKATRAKDAPDRRCVDCHGRNHGGLTTCEDCHDPARQWAPSPDFNHSTFFPLKYRHAQAACADCHVGGRFAGTPTNCSGCHAVVHTNLTACEKCHTPAGFVPSTFNHSAYFKITGRHTALDCADCHKRGVYNTTPTYCSGCHGTKHGGLSACQKCHTTAGFKPSTFEHTNVFVLVGAHAKLRCDKCHPGYRYAQNIGNGGTACNSCHAGPHDADITACKNCHTTTSWVPTKAITHPGYIQLGSEHQARSCTLCHPTLKFEVPTTPCEDCHASTIPHVGPTDCLRCHRPTTWSEVHFTHPELGIHEGTTLNQQCLWCHPGPDFTTWQCKSCHLEGGIPMVGAWLMRHSGS